MKRIIAAVCLALFALGAHAEDFCKPTAQKYIHAGQTGDNWWVYWWCPDGRIQWSPLIAADRTAARLVAGVAYSFGLNPGYMDGPSLRPIDDPLMQEIRAGVMAIASADMDRPPVAAPAQWWVQRNGVQTTRPAYPVVDGKRSTASNSRAAIDAPCDCATAIVEGRTTYCKVPPSANVSVCTKTKPADAPAPPVTPGTGGGGGLVPPKASSVPNAAPRVPADKVASASYAPAITRDGEADRHDY